LIGVNNVFRFDCGTGMAVLKSRDKVNVGDWNVVTAKRINNEGSLRLNNQDVDFNEMIMMFTL
jgi:chemotaxis receptor (MCP) glutamine deamidase CheD